MSWTLKANTGKATAPTGGTTSPIDTAGADIIFVHIADYSADSTTLSDSKGNTWTPLTATVDGVFCRSQWYYSTGANLVSVGAGHTFTATSALASYPTIDVLAFSGAAASPFDVQNGGSTGSGSSVQPGSITPSVNGELILTGITSIATGTLSIDSGFTISNQDAYGPGNNFGGAAAYFVQSTAAAINPTWSWSSGAVDAATRIASFKVSGAPPAATPTPINLLMQQQGWGQP